MQQSVWAELDVDTLTSPSPLRTSRIGIMDFLEVPLDHGVTRALSVEKARALEGGKDGERSKIGAWMVAVTRMLDAHR